MRAIAIDGQDGPLTALHAEAVGARHGLVLMIPGFTGSKEDFLATLPRLARRGWEVIAVSQRGQADAAAPLGQDAYSLECFADDVLRIAATVAAVRGEIPHVLGHSFGGVVVRSAAIADPSRFRSVTLFSSGPRAVPRTEESLVRLALLEELGGPLIFHLAFPELVDEPLPDPNAEMVRLRAHASSTDGLVAVARILGGYPDRTDALAATKLPVHVVVGEDDRVWPAAWIQEEADALGADLTVVPGAAHSAQIEAPDAFDDAVIAFWEALR